MCTFNLHVHVRRCQPRPPSPRPWCVPWTISWGPWRSSWAPCHPFCLRTRLEMPPLLTPTLRRTSALCACQGSVRAGTCRCVRPPLAAVVASCLLACVHRPPSRQRPSRPRGGHQPHYPHCLVPRHRDGPAARCGGTARLGQGPCTPSTPCRGCVGPTTHQGHHGTQLGSPSCPCVWAERVSGRRHQGHPFPILSPSHTGSGPLLQGGTRLVDGEWRV